MIEFIKNKNTVYAIIIRNSYENEKDGIEFFSPENFSMQLGYMKRPKGYNIEPHIHLFTNREINIVQEVLFLKKGKVRVDFYDDKKIFIKSDILKTGDIILLASGGHGFHMIEKSELFEVKQGPFSKNKDKEKFIPNKGN